MPVVSPKTETPPQPRPFWTPDTLHMDLDVAPMQDVRAKGFLDVDFRPLEAKPAPSVRFMEVFKAGQLVQTENRTGVLTTDERASAQSLRDALKGTNFLTDAKPFAEGDLAPNTTRLVFNDESGARKMLELPAMQPPAGYEAFFQATQDYAKVAFPKRG